MIHLICYGAAAALNLAWLLLGDRLSLWTQVSVPVITVLVAGIGVALRLWELPGLLPLWPGPLREEGPRQKRKTPVSFDRNGLSIDISFAK